MKQDKNPGQAQKFFVKVAKVLYALMRVADFVMHLTGDYFKEHPCNVITILPSEHRKSAGSMCQLMSAA